MPGISLPAENNLASQKRTLRHGVSKQAGKQAFKQVRKQVSK